jgi:16S rRNA (guanine527-N7)-methyltransferase
VKHAEMVQELSEYLALMGLRPEEQALELLVRHVELVLAANERVNLTRVVEPAGALRRHTADSLSVLEDLDAAAPGSVLDMGSGAGFPGIPLAICSSRRFTLLDSVGKKIREVDSMLVSLGLSERVTARAERAESFAKSRASANSVVVARAVSELPALVELASPLLATGGLLFCMKGSPDELEVNRAEEAGALVGMKPEYSRSFDLPQNVGHRTILCYRKVSKGKVALPRREGLAQHSPLA